jgi:hypothetical protein
VTEEPANLVTLKIRADDREWVLDEQDRRRKARSQVTHSELFTEMRRAYEATPATVVTAVGERNARYHEMLDAVLDHDPENAKILKGLLQSFTRGTQVLVKGKKAG